MRPPLGAPEVAFVVLVLINTADSECRGKDSRCARANHAECIGLNASGRGDCHWVTEASRSASRPLRLQTRHPRGRSLSPFSDKSSLSTALNAWCSNPASAEGTYGAIGSWDVSAVTDMNELVEDVSCKATFNEDIDAWNVGQVTTLSRMFRGAAQFNQPLHSWNVGSVTTFFQTFYRADTFNQPLNAWNVAKALNTHVRRRLPC